MKELVWSEAAGRTADRDLIRDLQTAADVSIDRIAALEAEALSSEAAALVSDASRPA